MAILTGNTAQSGNGRSVQSHFHMPDEAHPHTRTFMQWPVSRRVYGRASLEQVQNTIAEVANTIGAFEPVVMLMDEAHEQSARKKLSGKVEIWDIPTDDLWCRDSGPVFVKNEAGELAISHLNFNGWGNKQVHGNDAKIAGRVAERLGFPLFDNGIVGEGGGVDADGAGTLIAHESSWANQNRNKGSKAQVEKLLLQGLGGEKLIWAPGIKGGDITDYHIDALARFTGPGKVLMQLTQNPEMDDPWVRADYETYEILKAARDARGKKFDITVIPEPVDGRVKSYDFVASYVNYYVCNGAVIAAQFGDKETDVEAQSALARAYPGREIVMLNVDELGKRGGGIHCATQQQPDAGASL